MNKQEVRWVELPRIGSAEKGYLTVVERETAFPIQRVVWLHGLGAGMVRGQHANRRSRQLFFCLSGSLGIVTDLGRGEPAQVFHLVGSQAHRGLYVAPLVWRTLQWFTPGTVVLIISSEPYDESEYIRDYQEFMKEVGKL